MNSIDLHNIDFRNPELLVGIVAVVLLIAIAVALAASRRKRKSEALRERFGEEYDLALREYGRRNRAEAKLLERVKRVERLHLRELTPTERERFVEQWAAIQSRFVDHPRGAVTEADELVNSVMLARGFPAEAFDRRIEDISVHHARLTGSYRSANAIAQRASRNEATTEELRTALIHYRALFDNLLEIKPSTAADELPATPQLRRTA
jgi:hypothetical protein